MTDQDPRRRDDILVAEMAQSLKDHIERYERDYQNTQGWRKHMDQIQDAQTANLSAIIPVHTQMIITLAEHTKLLNEIAPNYRRGMVVLSTIVLGSIGCFIKLVWTHIKWN